MLGIQDYKDKKEGSQWKMLSTVHISYGLYKLLIDSDWIDLLLFLFHISKQKKNSRKPCTMHYSVNRALNCDFDKTHPCICDFEFSQNVLRHVVFCHRIYNKILIAGRPLTGPVLVAFLLKKKDTSHQPVSKLHPLSKNFSRKISFLE